MPYDLWYWPGIAGRGEFVRLTLEACGISYRDRARTDGEKALIADMARHDAGPAFAPPYLTTDDGTIAQTANILFYLADRHDCGPSEAKARYWLSQVQLTIMDMVAEAHNAHHPVAASLYHEEQKPEALRAAQAFRMERIAKYIAYFDRALGAEPGDWLAGSRWSYADLSLFHLVAGLHYAFPLRMATLAGEHPRVEALHERVAKLPELQDYLGSSRRLPFNNQDVFRHYPDLDAP
ncbi:MAG TPA: glutathione S-transferase [Sphingobium sp.]|nr:glutathione S-transferase [Sphingobium sp.]